VLAVGNLYPVKGHAVLVEAAARLKDLPVPWVVAVAGRGGEDPALRLAIDRLGLGGRFRLLGLRTDVPDLLAAADVFAMPSLSEGLPLALLEAMSAGLPVVASAVGGIPGVVRHGENGLLVPAGDAAALEGALRDLITGPGARRLGLAAAEEIPRRFGVEAMTQGYLAVYQKALRLSEPHPAG
jgi:glycosyltransferase involved in cell wall biosynthesis